MNDLCKIWNECLKLTWSMCLPFLLPSFVCPLVAVLTGELTRRTNLKAAFQLASPSRLRGALLLILFHLSMPEKKRNLQDNVT